MVEPLQLLFLGTAVSAALFAVIATAGGHWRPSRRSVLQGAAFGLLNPFLYYVVLFEAYDRLPAQIAQPLNYTWAITLALMAVPILGQPLTGRMITGILTGYAGVVVLLWGSGAEGGAADWLGVLLALGSTVIWAGYWLANARTTVPPVTLMSWSFLLSLPLVAAACYLGPGLPALTGETLGYELWVGLIEMGFTFLLWQRALRLTARAALIGQLIFLSPFLSLVMIGNVLGEHVRATSVVGLFVIAAGLWISRRD